MTSSIKPSVSTRPTVWSIAASDSSGGAGIQADVKTFFDLGVHGCTALTAVTVQNTQGVQSVNAVDVETLKQQLLALAEDLPPLAIKIGVLPSVESINAVIEVLQTVKNSTVIYDTVLAPTSGVAFSSDDLVASLDKLFPLVDVLTPNIPEAEKLTGITIHNAESQEQAAKALLAKGAASVLLKGGHSEQRAGQDVCQDLWTSADEQFWMTQAKQDGSHSHGTGCTLSAAIAAFVAHGKPVRDAVVLANAYVSKGIRLAAGLGSNGNKRGCVTQTGWPSDYEDFPQVSFTAEAVNLAPMPKCDSMNLGLYPVVDSVEWLQKLLELGVKTIQLRVKDVSDAELDTMVSIAAELGRQYDARLFINDYWQLAIKHRAYGVHLGQEDMVDADVDVIRAAGLYLGISTHGECEFSYAATFKPSYLAIGAIFPTDTKEVIEVGLDNLYQWSGILEGHFPLVAIGGINTMNIDSVLQSGVGSIAVVSAITKAENYTDATAHLMQVVEQG